MSTENDKEFIQALAATIVDSVYTQEGSDGSFEQNKEWEEAKEILEQTTPEVAQEAKEFYEYYKPDDDFPEETKTSWSK